MSKVDIEILEQEVADYAIKWWDSKSPVDWTTEMHLESPEVNCHDDYEKSLAVKVAGYLAAFDGR